MSIDRTPVGDTKVQKVLGDAELDMQDKKIWVAITAHNPLERIDSLLRVINAYSAYPCQVNICVYINYDAQDDVETLATVLNTVSHATTEIKVASPDYKNWYLTWAHKTDLALEILNRRADFYIYQENDMVLTADNFLYWVRWKPRLNRLGLEPGFVRYEDYLGKQVPFDNHYRYSLVRETPKVWSDVGFTVPKILVVDHDVNFFAQLANPYYGAMILNQADGEKYIRSESFDPEHSYRKVGIRNWPIADRSSMGLAFESVPDGYEHRRCVPVVRRDGVYQLQPCGLVLHDDVKYSKNLEDRQEPLLDCSQIFKLT